MWTGDWSSDVCSSDLDDKTVRIWDAKSGKEVRKLEGHSDGVWSVAFSPDGSRIAFGSFDKTIRIWDVKSGKEVQKLEIGRAWCRERVFFSEGSGIVFE